jgi:predicted amidohydrolase
VRIGASFKGVCSLQANLTQGKLYASTYYISSICANFKMHLTPCVIIPVRTFYYSRGTQLYCAPTVDARPVWQSTVTHIALEGRCFVLSACQYAEEKDYPPEHPVANATDRKPENVMIAGGSVIINPLGKVLAGPLLGGEGILTAELDLDDILKAKFDLDVVGHYARSDSKLPCLTSDYLWI